MSSPKANTLLVRALEILAKAERRLRGAVACNAGDNEIAIAFDELRAAGNHARKIIELAKVRVT